MLEGEAQHTLAVLGPLSVTLVLWAPCEGWALVGELAEESEVLRGGGDE